MNTLTKNLARKWRSKTFETIIGQDIAVRLLKNSLFLNQFFPVYLFSGQRGCGKTSSARIFAAALNCEQLSTFQKDPKGQTVPCGTCRSCTAMKEGNHPDFIEMDAASHTGVDNVRQIIEASTLLPVMGRKKIYLIDEAHMLSKAAFNALLKVLEEPPDSTTFMLATTDPHKIIDTVRSRCFQLFFSPVSLGILQAHLEEICTAEQIAYEPEALKLIVAESEGSVRDAINLLEAVRFSAAEVTAAAVHTILGRLADDVLKDLAQAVLEGSAEKLLQLWNQHAVASYSAEKLFDGILELLRRVLWAKYGVAPHAQDQNLSTLTASCTVQRVLLVLEGLCSQELAFNRTAKKHLLLELLLVRLCEGPSTEVGPRKSPLPQPRPSRPEMQRSEVTAGSRIRENKAASSFAVSHVPERAESSPANQAAHSGDVDPVHQTPNQVPPAASNSEAPHSGWASFVHSVESLNDPLLKSIFTQGRMLAHAETEVRVEFPEQLSFFADWLQETTKLWQPLLQQQFPGGELKWSFYEAEVVQKPRIKPDIASSQPSKPTPTRTSSSVLDPEKWPKTHLVLNHFPGTTSILPE